MKEREKMEKERRGGRKKMREEALVGRSPFHIFYN